MKYKIFLALAISSIALVGCKKKIEPKPKPEVKIEKGKTLNNLKVKSFQVDATDYNKWVYFSFKKGDVVAVENPENDLSWDIAFRRSDVKTNGGTSGKGLASGYETPFRTFADIVPSFITSHSDKYAKDKEISIPTDPNRDGQIKYIDVSLNPELNKGIWLEIRQNGPPTVHLTKTVYFFRSADGSYGAIKFTSYIKVADDNISTNSGYISFEYQYPFEFTKE